MKKILTMAIIAVAMLSASNAFAQKHEIPVDQNTQKIKFQAAVKTANTEDKCWNSCISWLNSFYTNAASVTSVRDYSSKKIIGTHIIVLDGKDAPIVNYTFTIEIRPGRYRYTITDLTLKGPDRMPIDSWVNKDAAGYDAKWALYLDQIATFVDNWAASLDKKMNFVVKQEEEDW